MIFIYWDINKGNPLKNNLKLGENYKKITGFMFECLILLKNNFLQKLVNY